MASGNGALTSSRLRRLAQRPERERQEEAPEQGPDDQAEERCDLCNLPIPPEHRHLVDVSSRRLMCACQACSLLFASGEAGGSHYRLVPDRRLLIEDFELDDARWDSLRIPVEMAFFFYSTPADRVMAFYPGPMGATESLLELGTWRELEAANPVLKEMEPDVEALLVNRAQGSRRHWVAPIDDCYDLVGLIRTHWKGLAGGQEVWDQIGRFFDQFAERAKVVSRQGANKTSKAPAADAAGGGEEEQWPRSS